jgi:hypothetical protein
MAKPYVWALRIPEILDTVRDEKSYWSRRMIQQTFGVKRTAARDIMRAVGHLHVHGFRLTVHTTQLKKFLIKANKTMDTAVGKAACAAKLSAFMKQCQANAASPPRRINQFTKKEPDSITVAELPKQIRLSRGEINIRFAGTVEAINLIDKLSRAINFDLEWFIVVCEPLLEQLEDTFQSSFKSGTGN